MHRVQGVHQKHLFGEIGYEFMPDVRNTYRPLHPSNSLQILSSHLLAERLVSPSHIMQ